MSKIKCMFCGYRDQGTVVEERTRELNIFSSGELIEGFGIKVYAECPNCNSAFLLSLFAKVKPDVVRYRQPDRIWSNLHGIPLKLREGTEFACTVCGKVFVYGRTECKDLCDHLRDREPIDWVMLNLVALVCKVPWRD